MYTRWYFYSGGTGIVVRICTPSHIFFLFFVLKVQRPEKEIRNCLDILCCGSCNARVFSVYNPGVHYYVLGMSSVARNPYVCNGKVTNLPGLHEKSLLNGTSGIRTSGNIV